MPTDETTKIPTDVVNLTGLLDGFGTTQISGLTRPKAEINRSALAGANASRISGARITERNIVMDIVPQGDGEEMRQALYDILPFDTMLRFYVETKQRCVYIDGYAEELEGDEPNGDEFSVQVSIICPFPWFQSVRLHTMKLVVGENTARNDGDIPAGFWLEINNDDPDDATINNLSLSIDGESFGYTGSIVAPYICTIPGRKKLNGHSRDGSPAFGMMNRDSDWIALKHGENIITVSTTTAPQFEASNTLYFRDTYSGV